MSFAYTTTKNRLLASPALRASFAERITFDKSILSKMSFNISIILPLPGTFTRHLDHTKLYCLSIGSGTGPRIGVQPSNAVPPDAAPGSATRAPGGGRSPAGRAPGGRADADEDVHQAVGVAR